MKIDLQGTLNVKRRDEEDKSYPFNRLHWSEELKTDVVLGLRLEILTTRAITTCDGCDYVFGQDPAKFISPTLGEPMFVVWGLCPAFGLIFCFRCAATLRYPPCIGGEGHEREDSLDALVQLQRDQIGEARIYPDE